MVNMCDQYKLEFSHKLIQVIININSKRKENPEQMNELPPKNGRL